MTVLTREEIQKLSGRPGKGTVSIYMPTNRASDIEQNQIRLKNLLARAEQEMIEEGLRTTDAKKVLQPARELLPNRLYWQHQSDGLAVFTSPGFFRSYRLPYSFPELVIEGDSFHIKPLLRLLSGDGLFYVLAVSQNEVRLLQCTRDSQFLVTPESIPHSMAEALAFDEQEKQLQYHTFGTGEGASAVFHGHGTGTDDKKDRILRFFQAIDRGLQELLKSEEAPLVLAGVDYLHPIYRKANHYRNLLDEGITGNPDGMTPEQLHEEAWALVEPYFERDLKNAIHRYGDLTGTGLAVDNIENAILAAHDGRISSLFVALGVQQWGIFDTENRKVQLHEERETGDEDLLDLITVYTLSQKGTVYVLEPEKMPGGNLLAAVLRY